MSPADRSDIPSSVREVLAYFLNHPGAAGSIRDLAESRIPQEIALHTLTQVSEAVFWLLHHNLLVPKQDLILTLNSARAAEAQDLLAQLARRPHPGEPPRPAAPPPPAAAGPPLATAPRGGALADACLAWVDATLLRAYAQTPLTAADHPGLTRDAATIPRLLAPAVPRDGATAGRTRDDDARALVEAFDRAGAEEPLAILVRELQLSITELQAFLLCLAPELDAKYQTVFGILNDDLHGRRGVTPGLLCRLLGDPLAVRQELERTGGLRRWRLVDHPASLPPHADDPLRPDPVVVAWLFGSAGAPASDPRLARLVRQRPWAGADWLRQPDDSRLVELLRELCTGPAEERWVALVGGERDGARAAVEAALADLPLLRIVLPSPPPTDPVETSDITARLARAVRLTGATAVVDTAGQGADALGVDGLQRLLAELCAGPRPVIVITHDVERIVAALPRLPGRSIHIELAPDGTLAGVYAAAAARANLQIGATEAERLALAYPMSLDAIEDAIWFATLNGAALREPSEHYAALAAACRRVACPALPRFGRRIEPIFRLHDVVLPPAQHAELAEIVAHVRHASQVMHGWRFRDQLPYGRGVTALFSGPSGTGKTMAAQAIARELDTDAYVVDLSRVVSKYIGESEKNLDAVFSDAERAGAVLLFDEADALFGKRSEIKDAHDRYANIEVAYLLQRMEAFAGLAILTTNFKQNLDPAFVRRLRFILDFSKPDERAREAIWRRCLSPAAAGVRFRFLAKRLDITGGTIQQIAVRAAFAAASAGAEAIDMRHVMPAARAELLKLGLTATERELGAFEAAWRRGVQVA